MQKAAAVYSFAKPSDRWGCGRTMEQRRLAAKWCIKPTVLDVNKNVGEPPTRYIEAA